MNLSALSKYEVISGEFVCQNCNQTINSSRFYKATLELTWKCKKCEHVSNVSIYKKRGY